MPITSVSRPVYRVAGLLTEKPEILAICRELASAGADAAAVEILCGERGAAILDEHGRYHGLRGRIVRAFQRLGTQLTALVAGTPRTCVAARPVVARVCGLGCRRPRRGPCRPG